MNAKRGDLVLIEERRDYGNREWTFDIERVVSVTRDGLVKATAKWIFGQESTEVLFRTGTDRFGPFRRPRVYYVGHRLIPAADVDVAALWAAWCGRAKDWYVPPFRSLDEAKAFAQPFRRQEVTA